MVIGGTTKPSETASTTVLDWWADLDPELRKLVVGAINHDESPPSSEPWAFYKPMYYGAAIGTIAFGAGGLLAGALAGAAATGVISAVESTSIKF